jgi:hypothetical protein
MNHLSYVVRNWKSIIFRYSIIENSKAGVSWSAPIINRPHLEGVKLYLPSTKYLDAGYINLKTLEVVENEGITPVGKSRLQEMFIELTTKAL